MARALTDTEKATLRTDGQFSELYLAVAKYNTIYTARLASLPTGHDGTATDMVTEIVVTGGSGTLEDIKAGMTLYVGTTAGAYDLGMCRIRETPTDTTWKLGETSEINWSASVSGGLYLTIVDDFGLWAKPIKIQNETPYMDVDVAYTDQHKKFLPVPVMGTHRAKFLDPVSNSITISPNGSNSWVHGSTITSYSWSFPGASSTTGLNTATPTATYTNAGTYPFYLTVTSAEGKSNFGVRYAMIFDAEHPPITAFQLDEMRANYDDGGYSFDVTLWAEADKTDIRDRALCVLFAKDYFDGIETICPSPMTDAENIICVGWIAEENNTRNALVGTVNLNVRGANYWMKNMMGFPSGLEFVVGEAQSWTDMPLLTVDRYAWHFLEWRTTATRVMDIYLTGDTRYATELASLADNLWGQLRENLYTTIYATMGVDEYGRLYAEIEPQMVMPADRTWATVMEIEYQDWEGDVEWSRIITSPLSQVNLSGVSVDASKSALSFFALATGHVFNRYGEAHTEDRLLVGNQTTCNNMAGLYMGWKNDTTPQVRLHMASNFRALGLFPHQKVFLTINPEDDPRGIGLSGYFVPREIERSIDPMVGFLRTTVTLELETQPALSVNGDIPGRESFDFSVPPLPALPALPVLPVILTMDDYIPTKVIIKDRYYGMIYTENFNETSPTWRFINGGLTPAQYQGINRIEVTPYGRIYAAIVGSDTDYGNDLGIYTVEQPGGIFTNLINRDWIKTETGATTEEIILSSIGINKLATNQIAFIGGKGLAPPLHIDGYFWLGNEDGVTAGAHITSGIQGLSSSLSFGAGEWIYTGQAQSIFWTSALWNFGSNGTTQGATVYLTSGAAVPTMHARAGSSGIIYIYHREILEVSTDNGASHTTLSPGFDISDSPCGLSTDPTSSYIMAANYSGTGVNRSTDYGATWTTTPALPAAGRYCVSWAATSTMDSTRFVAASNSVYYTSDFGDTWEDKNGNLFSIVPTPNIEIIKVIG